MVVMEIHEKLQLLLAAKGWTQKRVAAEIGIGPSGISKWFSGENKVPADKIADLARIFGVPPEYLADDTLTQVPPGLSDDERMVLRLSHLVGIDEALRRLSIASLRLDLETGKIFVGAVKLGHEPNSVSGSAQRSKR